MQLPVTSLSTSFPAAAAADCCRSAAIRLRSRFLPG
jgi:hypothetical protein